MDPSINNDSAPHSQWGPFHKPCPTAQHLHRGVNHARPWPAWHGISLRFCDRSPKKTPQHLGLDELGIEPAPACPVPIVTTSLSPLYSVLPLSGECPHTGTFWVSRMQWHKTAESASQSTGTGLRRSLLKARLWRADCQQRNRGRKIRKKWTV